MSRDMDGLLAGLDIWNADWLDKAACKGADYDMFFIEGKGVDYSPALAVCETCPVQADCLAHAMRNNEQHGVWGGTTPNGRRLLRQGKLPKGRQPAPLQHGTEYAYRLCTEGPDGGKCDTCRGGHARRGADYKSRAS